MSHSRPVFGSYLTHAPGDFFLISRRTLTKIRGYPQIPHMKHVDTLIVYAAGAHGLKQLVMKSVCSVHHQDTGMIRNPFLRYRALPRSGEISTWMNHAQ